MVGIINLARFLLLSNGHGEDLSGSLLAKILIEQGNQVDALPIVGHGQHYQKFNVPIIGNTKLFRTAGLGYNTLRGRLDDLFNGQIIYLLKQLFLVFNIKNKYDYFLVVGDIVPIFFSWIYRKKFFIYLVAYSSHYEGKLNLPWPCKFFLKTNKLKKIYARDHLTAIDLTNQLNREVSFLGNPFMDGLGPLVSEESNNSFTLAFLPGSRMPELLNNFDLMLELIDVISNNKFFQKIQLDFALIDDFTQSKVEKLIQHRNWQFKKSHDPTKLKYKFNYANINFRWQSFNEILKNSNLVISMSGTAAEQAIGLYKPVIQLEGNGPQFTKSFAEAQRRLLGKYVFCATQYFTKEEQINNTLDLILKVIYLMKLDSNFLLDCKNNAKTRIGDIGASERILNNIEYFISNEK